MSKIIRVNMTDKTVKVTDVPAEYAGIAGRALTSTIVAAEVPPTCHPLGPSNKLVFAPGFLTGTPAANSGRYSCGAKSPLTGTIKESSSGGTAPRIIARMGITALIIEGQPKADEGWFRIRVSKDGAVIEPETETIGKGNFEVVESATKRWGEDVAVISIGQAGEHRMNLANISTKDPEGKVRSFGRGGLGAVMGSKKVKFITLDPTGAQPIKLADPEAFKKASAVFTKALNDHPVSGQGLRTYGTAILINILDAAGGLPTKNFTNGQCAHHDQISGETIHATITSRGGETTHGCSAGCIIQCSQIYKDKDGKYLTSGFEYETVWALGADCMISELDDCAWIDNIMDEVGVDSIETPVMFAVAMEAGILPWGDGKAMARMLKEDIAKATPLGCILGGGTELVGKTYGLTRVPVVKGQGIPAYDPRPIKGIGVTYATSTMGADHTSGYAIATNILNVGGSVDPLKNDGQVELSRNLQIATAAVDSTGLCLFIAFPALDIAECLPAVVDMINARYGINLTGDDVVALGKKVLKIEKDFNTKAGFGPEADRLPEFFELEPCPPHNLVWDMPKQYLESFWNF